MAQKWLVWCGVLGGIGVAAGAFGAHVLKPVLPLQVMAIFETAVRYHLIHTLALFGTAALMGQYPAQAKALGRVAALFVAGIVLFSGSLYGLSLSDLRWLGLITPLGGLAWVVAWLLLAGIFWRALRASRGS